MSDHRTLSQRSDAELWALLRARTSMLLQLIDEPGAGNRLRAALRNVKAVEEELFSRWQRGGTPPALFSAAVGGAETLRAIQGL